MENYDSPIPLNPEIAPFQFAHCHIPARRIGRSKPHSNGAACRIIAILKNGKPPALRHVF